ncbi:alpha-amylase [Sulfurifustis variabilis]|uniref:Alpha-amylase n=1 Tax=Sulfurifustis variabilis TaxID=1675686 RepID=A0A1B4V9U7_9GAMM|nr:alpha-amylase family glycosyl hydrolase [Sulfurifustis variabilis]BAU48274.1 alpha-amylase [Sulfurifustis variabilis]
MSGEPWWRHAVVYQIYPLSFQDSDGDGYGDLRGIRVRLEYLDWLGVDAIWLSPIYPSPMADFGYDVADYTGVDAVFGTLAEFDALLAEAHARGIRLILDFVPNHSSDRHPWFVESRTARDARRRDWYIWRDPAPGGGPPNNWLSVFGGSAWAYEEATGQYYYHAFLNEQPDLNWRNPAVREAMHGALRFWLDRGVDGFRLDAIWHLIKDERFRDNPPNPAYRPDQPPFFSLLPVYSTDRPEVHDVLAELRRTIDAYADRLLIGEIYLPIERLIAYYGKDLAGLHLPFNFSLIQAAWKAHRLAALVEEYERALPPGGWPNWVLGNHDKHRIATRVGSAQAAVAAMLLLTLRGTPTLYYGDEIGMRDVALPADRVRDPWARDRPAFGRDAARTPMQWDAGAGAGFTEGMPWLPVAEDLEACNVASQRADPSSLLHLYRALIALRRTEPALLSGSYEPVVVSGDALAFRRRHDTRSLLVALNLGGATQRLLLPSGMRGRIALGTRLDRGGERVSAVLTLRGDEGVIVRLE